MKQIPNWWINMKRCRWNTSLTGCFSYSSLTFLEKFVGNARIVQGNYCSEWLLYQSRQTTTQPIFLQYLIVLFTKKTKSKSLLTEGNNSGPKLPWSTQQASSMHLRHGTSLLSTPLPFWTCIITLGKEKGGRVFVAS